MTRRRLIALVVHPMGWTLLVWATIGIVAVDEPELQRIVAEQSPLPAPPPSEQRIALLIVGVVPGASLCLFSLFLWESERRRERMETRRVKVTRSWSEETLHRQLESWLAASPWQPPTPEEAARFAAQLEDRDKSRLATFLEHAGGVRLAGPPREPERNPTPGPGCGWWSAAIGFWTIAAFIVLWTLLSTVLIPSLAAASNVEAPISPPHARGGLILGMGTACPFVVLGAAMASVATRRRRDAVRAESERLEHSRDVLAATRRLVTVTTTNASIAEPDRERILGSLLHAAEPELVAGDRRALGELVENASGPGAA